MSNVLHAALCVLVPLAIGLAVFGLFELWDRRRTQGAKPAEPPTIDYLI